MPDVQKYITIKKATKTYGVSARVLSKWEEKGHIQSSRTPLGTRMYSCAELDRVLGVSLHENSKKNFCYCRVPSLLYSAELEKQIDFLKVRYPTHTFIQDIGSGVDFTRKGFNMLLDHVSQRNIGEVVIMNKDRLTRIGYEMLESLIVKAGGNIIVLDNEMHSSTCDEERTQDLLLVVKELNDTNNA